MNLEEDINKLLEVNKMSLRGLSAATGLTTGTLYNIFQKNDAKLSQLDQIANALKVPLSVLIFKTDVTMSARPVSTDSEDKFLKAENTLIKQLLDSKEKQIQMLEHEVARLKAELGKIDGGRDARQTG